jgi:hypothetical protein
MSTKPQCPDRTTGRVSVSVHVPLRCDLDSGHDKAHRGNDDDGRRWVWWTFGNDRSICRLLDQQPVGSQVQDNGGSET